jgi:hypothetical protein
MVKAEAANQQRQWPRENSRGKSRQACMRAKVHRGSMVVRLKNAVFGTLWNPNWT